MWASAQRPSTLLEGPLGSGALEHEPLGQSRQFPSPPVNAPDLIALASAPARTPRQKRRGSLSEKCVLPPEPVPSSHAHATADTGITAIVLKAGRSCSPWSAIRTSRRRAPGRDATQHGTSLKRASIAPARETRGASNLCRWCLIKSEESRRAEMSHFGPQVAARNLNLEFLRAVIAFCPGYRLGSPTPLGRFRDSEAHPPEAQKPARSGDDWGNTSGSPETVGTNHRVLV
jgi:hypothetical protein